MAFVRCPIEDSDDQGSASPFRLALGFDICSRSGAEPAVAINESVSRSGADARLKRGLGPTRGTESTNEDFAVNTRQGVVIVSLKVASNQPNP